MSSQQNSQGWQRGVNQQGNQYDHRGDGAAQGGKAAWEVTTLIFGFLLQTLASASKTIVRFLQSSSEVNEKHLNADDELV